jgi:hypothetical protein
MVWPDRQQDGHPAASQGANQGANQGTNHEDNTQWYRSLKGWREAWYSCIEIKIRRNLDA